LISTASKWRRLSLSANRSFSTWQSLSRNSTEAKTTFTTFFAQSCIWKILLTNMTVDKRSRTRSLTWFRTS
jgi:hypothetical protein